MSCSIQLNRISKSDLLKIKQDLNIEDSTFLYEITEQEIILPFYYGMTNFYSDTPIKKNKSAQFEGQLFDKQNEIKNQCLLLLDKHRCAIIKEKPGFGKTIVAINLLCDINLPCAILVKQTVIIDQWETSLKKHAPQKTICRVASKCIAPNADVYLVNPILLKTNTEYYRTLFNRVKFVIIDECHQIMTKVLITSLFKFSPLYLLGLSATPYRLDKDPYQKAIPLFFGPTSIGTALYKKHNVYIIETQFFPHHINVQSNGKLDWNSILTQQAEDENRNKQIVDNICKFPDRVWLILVKRVNHATELKKIFLEKNITCETMTGTKKTFDKNCKILIGTTSKIGVGFDHTPINALCVAADIVAYFVQFLGRCMRRPDVEPIVLDFSDKFGPLKKHFNSRVEEYTKYGGVIKSL